MEDSNVFKPTVEWMAEQYEIFNQKYFRGELTKCDFDIRKIDTKYYGLFHFQNEVKGDRRSGRLFSVWFGRKTWIDKENFYEECRPQIVLNNRYFGTERGCLSTLLHEMCHLYTYMNGRCPKQGHGPEFRMIAAVISRRTGGLFTVESFMSADEQKEFKLNDEDKARLERRQSNRKSNVMTLLVKTNSGPIRLLNTTSQKLLDDIYAMENPKGSKVYVCKDEKLYDFLKGLGYGSVSRLYRCWRIEGEFKLQKELEAYNFMEYKGQMEEERSFSFKRIVEEVLKELNFNTEQDDSFEILPTMNLSEESPFE